MSPAQYWLVAAIVLFILEIITPGFVLANFGVAALAAAAAAWFDASMTMQVLVFSVVCVISFVTLRPLMNKFIYRNQAKARTGIDAVVGMVGTVTEAIRALPEGGRVQLGGDNWHALAADGGEIGTGVRVVVVRVDSTTVIVEPKH
jgi:membrane protein implicated in regulation of membrane protease activity